MCPFGVTIEPEPVLAELGPVGTITRTEALSARTKLGSRPPAAGFGCSGGAVGFAGRAWVAGGTVGLAGGSVGLACATCVGGGAVGFAAAVGTGVEVDDAETGRTVGVARLSATAPSTSAPVPTIATISTAMMPPI